MNGIQDGACRPDKLGDDDGGVIMRIPRASIWNVLEVTSEYDFPSLPTLVEPRVLDIGANVGVFAIACAKILQGARIMSFEPHPETFAMLKDNVAGLPVEVHHAAVTDWAPGPEVDLYEGARNRLCCSLVDRGDQDMTRSLKVPAFLASELPPCDLMKIDTEGHEVQILEKYRHLDSVKVLLTEIHGANDAELRADGERVASIAAKAGLHQIDQRSNTLRFKR